MDNSYFHPYLVLHQTLDGIELKISGARKLVLIITWRLLPFFIFSMLGILAIESTDFPWKIKLGLVFIAVLAMSMLLVKILHRISISPTSISVTVYRLFYNRQLRYSLKDIENITVYFSDQVRSGAILYYLKLKSGKKVEFMRQPAISSTRDDMEKVCEQLRRITKLKVEIRERKL